MKVTVSAKLVITGPFRGTNGQTVDVPDNVADIWIKNGFATQAADAVATPTAAPVAQTATVSK